MRTVMTIACLAWTSFAGSLVAAEPEKGAGAPWTAVDAGLEPAAFEERWSWGKARADRTRGTWIGYAVERWSRPDSYLISGITILRGGLRARGSSLREDLGPAAPTPGTVEPINVERPGLERRPLAILVGLDAGGRFDRVRMTDLTFPVDLEGRSLLWIGEASADESFRFLTDLYGKARGEEAKEDLVEAVGVHQRAEATSFLARILTSRESAEIREEAAQSLGDQSDRRAVEVLAETARRDRSLSVRQEAAEALGDCRAAGAGAALAELARTVDDSRVRAEAVEALGESETLSASEVLLTLAEIVYRDESSTVREEALEALGERPRGEGLALLVKVAGTHPNRALREEAIDVLADRGEDDVRARRALLTLLGE